MSLLYQVIVVIFLLSLANGEPETVDVSMQILDIEVCFVPKKRIFNLLLFWLGQRRIGGNLAPD